MFLRVQKSVNEWTFTLPSELPFSKAIIGVKTHWLEEILYIIGKLLKHRCLKWAHMTHLDIWNISYDQKKGRELIWFHCVQVMCDISLESPRWGLQLCFKFHFNQNSTHKVMRPQNNESPNFEIFETPIWESPDKMSFGCGPRGEAKSIL